MNNYKGIDNNTSITHYGVLGMRWKKGRHYRNEDGTLNNRGLKKAEKLKKTYKELTNKSLPAIKKNKSKAFDDTLNSVSNRKLSDKQLSDKIQRLRDEQTARNLQNDVRDTAAKKFIKKIANDAITPAIMNAGRDVLQTYLKNTLSELTGLNKNNSKDSNDLNNLKKQWQKSDYIYKKMKTDEQIKKMKERIRD